jgi:CubicO group peptidase (beta-lactamase class C family)
MHRRKFLAASTQAAVAYGLLPVAPRAQENQTSTALKSGESSAGLVANLEKLLPNLMEKSIVPGLSIALVQDRKLLWRKAFGVKDSATKEPVDQETVFEAASVSKTVFAYLAVNLCEKSVLGLDRPLAKDAPKPFLDGDPRLELITPRHVLSHTSGFQNWRSKEEDLKIHFAPGQKFLYSGEGYHYLQSVITRLKGHVDSKDCAKYERGFEVCATDIDPYLKRNLLTPFGMDSSGFVWNEAFERHAAHPHDSQGKSFVKKKPGATDAARYGSAGGLHTTAADYAKFLIEILAPKESDAFRLSKKSLQEMFRPQIKLGDGEKIDGADSWALGWAVQERKTGNVILHSGGNAGFSCLTMASVERRSGFIILTNSDNGGKVFYSRAFAELVNPLLDGTV